MPPSVQHFFWHACQGFCSSAGPGSLTANYVFERFNPSVGLTWNPIHSVNAYARYSQGSRAPTSIELGCADPANPCSLPNALASDPPLKQVVTDTWEVGLRGHPEFSWARNLSWSVGAFRANNHNDILFVTAPVLGTGYFQNFGQTRREGVDADLGGMIKRMTWGLDYTFVSATYQSTDSLDGGANNTSDSALSGYPGLDGNTGVTAQGAVTTRPFPASTTDPFAGTYPAQSAIFYAPAAPLRAWVELRVRFRLVSERRSHLE